MKPMTGEEFNRFAKDIVKTEARRIIPDYRELVQKFKNSTEPLTAKDIQRFGSSSVLLPGQQIALIFGGYSFDSSITGSKSGLKNDLLAFDVVTHEFSLLQTPQTTIPEPRAFHTAVFSEVTSQMIISGGTMIIEQGDPDYEFLGQKMYADNESDDSQPPQCPAKKNDVWSYSLADNTWVMLRGDQDTCEPTSAHLNITMATTFSTSMLWLIVIHMLV